MSKTIRRSVTGIAIQDITGRRFGKLTVLRLSKRRTDPGGKIAVFWVCRCDCGKKARVRSDRLKTGMTRSCGCLLRKIRGLSRSPEHKAWCHMLERCYSKSDKGYAYYGGRGIKVCERWRKSFLAFLDDVGFRPGPRYSIDRIDNDGNYRPGNCRWATKREQMLNRRMKRTLTWDGETKQLAEWAEATGVSASLILHRLSKWGSVDRALGTPVREQGPYRRLPTSISGEQIEQIYRDHGNWKSVMKVLGCSKKTLLRLRRKFGIRVRTFHWR